MAEVPEIRLLGEIEVSRDGRVSALPASKKTRALLGFLAATGRPHTREQLCDLLWQGPDDPRAALRWSLAKLRGVVGATALVADREHVALGAVTTDLDAVRALLKGGIDDAPAAVLASAAERFRGELLEGLALPDCYRYHEWFTAERESARALRVALVQALVLRSSDPDAALRWAREHVALDPLSEAAHIAIIRLLTELGRRREAIAQFETCRRILAQEAGQKPSPALLEARMQVTSSPGAGVEQSPQVVEVSSEAPPNPTAEAVPEPLAIPFVGRTAEIETALGMLERAGSGSEKRVLIVLGEPGIGKSRILAEVGDRARQMGGTVLSGRAFEAEMVRPYGPFIDALKGVPAHRVPDALKAELAALAPGFGSPGAPHDRASMFDAVVRLLVHLASVAGPVAVLLDDVHWFDEASAGLLHYVARALGGARVLVACGARPGELSDNAAALRLVRGLSREHRAEAIDIGPLDSNATAALSRAASPGVDLERVVRDSGGNPLLVLELTRALARDASAVWESVADLIAERLARLDAAALDLVSWAAALGKSFDLATLEGVTGMSPVELVRVIGDLERHGIVRASADGVGFDFVHDLVRTGAYRRLSEPARRVVHRRIARTLDEASRADPALAGEVAHHAELGGDAALVVRASVVAAQLCIRVFAGAEGARLAELGLSHLDALPREERLSAQLALLEVLVYSGTSARRQGYLETELARTVAEAQGSGAAAVASKAFHLLSVLQFDEGNLVAAHESTLRAAGAVRGADPLARARQLGDSARCLGTLERDMDQAQAMMAEARALAAEFGAELLEVCWAFGVLCAFSGDVVDAVESLERALRHSRNAGDRWAEYECLRELVQLDLERGVPTDRGADLLAVASKMGGGSELPSAHALHALDRLVRGDAGAEDAIEQALATLRTVDAKGMSAYVLAFVAERDAAAGRLETAESRASEALRAALVVNRPSQAALARVVLGRVALSRGDPRTARRHLDTLAPDLARGYALNARARAAAQALSVVLSHDRSA